jgi:hypothetical protein
MKRVRATLPYSECGLDNVILVNVPVWQCKNEHRDAQIPAVKELHDALAQIVVSQPWPLVGPDVRFLRKHLGYSGRAFSAAIGLNHVTLSKFENQRKRIPKRLNALVRLFCAQAMCERQHRPLPKPLIPVLQQLETDGTTLLRDLRLEHVEIESTRAAEPRERWQEEYKQPA